MKKFFLNSIVFFLISSSLGNVFAMQKHPPCTSVGSKHTSVRHAAMASPIMDVVLQAPSITLMHALRDDEQVFPLYTPCVQDLQVTQDEDEVSLSIVKKIIDTNEHNKKSYNSIESLWNKPSLESTQLLFTAGMECIVAEEDLITEIVNESEDLPILEKIRAESNERLSKLRATCNYLISLPAQRALFIENECKNFGVIIKNQKKLDRLEDCQEVVIRPEPQQVNELRDFRNIVLNRNKVIGDFFEDFKNFLTNVLETHRMLSVARDSMIRNFELADLPIIDSMINNLAKILENEAVFVIEKVIPAYETILENKIIIISIPFNEIPFKLDFRVISFMHYAAIDCNMIRMAVPFFSEFIPLLQKNVGNDVYSEKFRTLENTFCVRISHELNEANANFDTCYAWLCEGKKNARPVTHDERIAFRTLKFVIADLSGTEEEVLVNKALETVRGINASLRNAQHDDERDQESNAAALKDQSKKMREEAQRLDEQKQRDLRLSDSCMKVVRTLNDSLDKQTLDSNTLGQLTALLQPENAIDYKVMCKIGGLINRIKKTFSLARGFSELQRAFLNHPNSKK